MENKENKKQEIEVKPLAKSYEEYKRDRTNDNRRLTKPNKFRKKIMHIIDNAKAEDMKLGLSLEILFYCVTVEQHKEFLYKHLEEGQGNIMRTIENIQKAKARSVSEILVLENLKDKVKLQINTHGRRDYRAWDLVVGINYGELTIDTVVKYSKVKEYLNEETIEKIEDEEITDKSYLGVKYLNKQQYFIHTLKDSLNLLDKSTIALLFELKK